MFSIALSKPKQNWSSLCHVRDRGRALNPPLNPHGSFPGGNEGANISMRLLQYAYMYMYRIRD
jgi:hypothetical protein